MSHAIPAASGTAGTQITSGSGDLIGISCRESAGTPAAATLVIRDGTDASGKPLVFVNLAQSTAQTLQLPPVHFTAGLYLDRTSGTSEVVVHIA